MSIDASVGASFGDFLNLFMPHLIHFHCIQGLSASIIDMAHWRGIPYVVSVHDGWWISDYQFLMDTASGKLVFDRTDWGNPVHLDRLRLCLRNAAQVTVPSEVFAELYRSRVGIDVVVLENAVKPLPVEGTPGIGKVVIGLLGGLGIAKGADLLRRVLYLKKFDCLEFIIVDHYAFEGTERYEYWGLNL